MLDRGDVILVYNLLRRSIWSRDTVHCVNSNFHAKYNPQLYEFAKLNKYVHNMRIRCTLWQGDVMLWQGYVMCGRARACSTMG